MRISCAMVIAGLLLSACVSDDSSLSREDSAVPIEDGAVADGDSAVPIEDGAVPMEDGAVPMEDGAVPTEDGAVPTEDSDIVATAAWHIGYAAGDSIDRVTADLTLPSSDSGGVTITWTSSNPDLISVSGQVTRPAFDSGDSRVTLTATITKGSASVQKTVTVFVARQKGWMVLDGALYEGDGTEAGSRNLLEALATEGFTPTLTLLPALALSTTYLPTLHGKAFFVADDGEGYRLWRTDGTVAGTLRLDTGSDTFPADQPFVYNLHNGLLSFTTLRMESVPGCGSLSEFSFDIEKGTLWGTDENQDLYAYGGSTVILPCPIGPVTPEQKADEDDDGLLAFYEAAAGSSDNNPDSDGDGWSDGYEVLSAGTDPMKHDTDGDYLPDSQDPRPLDYDELVLIVPNPTFDISDFNLDYIKTLLESGTGSPVVVTRAPGSVVSRSVLATAIMDFGDSLRPYIRNAITSSDSGDPELEEAEIATRSLYYMILDGSPGYTSWQEIGEKVIEDTVAGQRLRDALAAPLGAALKQALKEKKALSTAQQSIVSRIAANINGYRTRLGQELEAQYLDWASQPVNPFSLKTLPDIVLSAQQATTQLVIATAVGAQGGAVVGTAAYCAVSIGIKAIYPFTKGGSYAAAAKSVSGGTGMAAIIGVAVAAVVIGVVSAVLVAQHAENKNAFENMQRRAGQSVSHGLSELNLDNELDVADFLVGLTATMLEIKDLI